MLGSNKEKDVISYPMQDITHLEGSPGPEALQIREAAPGVRPLFLRNPMSQCFPEAHSQLSGESILESTHPGMVTAGNTSSRPELDSASVDTDRTVLSGSFLSRSEAGGDHEQRVETLSSHWFWQPQVTTQWSFRNEEQTGQIASLTSQMNRSPD